MYKFNSQRYTSTYFHNVVGTGRYTTSTTNMYVQRIAVPQQLPLHAQRQKPSDHGSHGSGYRQCDLNQDETTGIVQRSGIRGGASGGAGGGASGGASGGGGDRVTFVFTTHTAVVVGGLGGAIY